VVLNWYRTLIQMRRGQPALARLDRDRTTVDIAGDGHTLVMRRWSADQEILAAFHLGAAPQTVNMNAEAGEWDKLLDSGEERWLGSGTSIATCLESEGTIDLALHPKQCIVLSSGSSG
jgi:maltooligosyltrehalose trehalohydrolase